MRPDDEAYFETIESQLDEALAVAREAKRRGDDPSPEVEIPVAKDMADRVENILGIDGVAERVRDLEGEMSREEAALELVEDFVEGTVGDYDTKAGKVEGAVRTAVALLTEGVVAAPIEGIDRVELTQNDDGTEFISVYYAGPIRSAGGTAQALSVLVADYARALLDINEYRPRDEEVKRYAEEVDLYDQETGLQYSPKEEESEYIASNTPICLDGEATGQEEVSGYRDLERVDTNNPRGGMCLVLAEGIALKAPKIQRYTRDLDEVDWPWLQDLIDGTITDDANGAEDDDDADEADDGGAGASDDPGPPRVEESWKYLRDLIAGRPVFGHPSAEGGFRLRYGRARNHGFATAGVHPATMHIVDDFLATGTQIKTERPGKAAGVVPVDSIEGPTVKLANGDVRRIDDPEEALDVRNGVEAILDLGEYLVNYGEFVENNHPLAPASYTVEWWVQELEAAGANVQALRDSPYVDLERPDAEQALNWAQDQDVPLHPAYTYLWHDLDVDRFATLAAAVADAEIVDDTLHIPRDEPVREALEVLLVEHTQSADVLVVPDWRPLTRTLGVSEDLTRQWTDEDLPAAARDWDNAMKAVNEVAPFSVRERAPTRIGNRMGRPEKSESRELSPAVHTLFPIGEAGGNQRNVSDAASHTEGMNDRPGRVTVPLGVRECRDCGEHTYKSRCPACGGRTDPHYECSDCGIEAEPDESGRVECPRCEREVDSVEPQTVDLNGEYHEALKAVGERENAFEILKGVKGLASAEKVPEPIEKGVLRAKHGVSTFKDGTVRYDMTDLPVTAVRPAELDVTVGQFRELGYEEDVHGDPLEHPDQLVELRVQFVVLSDGAAEHMHKTADFVDDLLEKYYGLDSFYGIDDRDDLVGELVFGMAPHTSAAVVGRVVGFTSAAVGYAHPYFHASKRRNCFVPETKVWIRDEDGAWRYESIETVVEERLEDPWTDDMGTLVEELDDPIYVPSLEADGSPTLESVSAVSKHVATDHLIEVETRSGRSLTVTPDHSMRTWENGVCELEAHQVEVGDVIPRPASSLAEAEFATGRFAESVASSGSPSNRGDGSTGHTGGDEIASDGGKVWLDEVVSVDIIESDVDHTYSFTVENTHTLLANDLFVGQCDGDEDCVMLLMDGLLNFSKAFLPDSRGGRMDAPLVMSSRIDPAEIDDEAHNMDVVGQYPREFYEATREMAPPEDVDITIAEDRLGTDAEYSVYEFTHDTTDIALGPDLSAYKTLGSMMDKMDAQLELARKLRAVDETDVAERVIEYHFLPDLIGNLRAFSRQETRCLSCGTKYRRAPLTGECRECGGDVTLTVHEGSVSKYLDTALEVAEEYGAREYTKQRLHILERSIESILENDKNKQSGIADFM
ncbi:DNA-directed DNA polymerase II large subunit [Halanaeroarchaeum sulfurireducens]|uniref:DNA polymerase II large subunit n=1 Tax=Halanaeroarchaeum sulfurireducens TaxID=1604004 RepID=A0A0N9MZN6_9EURY|nr:DNA-directed DNA polymerase II large subunit [Halanaeroarchaeum sulfurireducens]ALG80966.1 DNA polymerase II large subunit [Halanaeroarchaeum sulfurireducens]